MKAGLALVLARPTPTTSRRRRITQVEASGGVVREIRIWNVALTDAQIAAI